MDTATLRKNFEDQLASTDKQIAELEGNLKKAQEYKLKLQGGLETIDLVEKQESDTQPDIDTPPDSTPE